MEINTYTVFCHDGTGKGTIWIGAVEAASLPRAKAVGRRQCANDWQYDVHHVQVLGVAAGNVEILDWDINR